MSEVEILEGVKDQLMAHPLISVNYTSLEKDFSFLYKDTLEVDQPEEVPEAALVEAKSNLFMAFCWGAVTATDGNSTFRRNFNLPKKVLEQMGKKKIIGPNEGNRTKSGLILPR